MLSKFDKVYEAILHRMYNKNKFVMNKCTITALNGFNLSIIFTIYTIITDTVICRHRE